MTKNDIKNLETVIWQGEDSFDAFMKTFGSLGYKYVIKCYPSNVKLGAACKDEKELAEMLIEFSERDYSCKVQRVDVVSKAQLN